MTTALHLLADNEPLPEDQYEAIARGLGIIERLHRDFDFGPRRPFSYDQLNFLRCFRPYLSGFDMLPWEMLSAPSADQARATRFRVETLERGVLRPGIMACGYACLAPVVGTPNAYFHANDGR